MNKPSVYDLNLWQCVKECGAKISGIGVREDNDPTGGRKVIIGVGEIVEYRYHSPLHFRTKDNRYFKLDDAVFYAHFKPYGKIWSRVKFQNIAVLEEILRLKLFDKQEP